MVDLRKDTRGEGAMKAVNVVVRTYSNAAVERKNKDGEVSVRGQYLDVQLDARDPRAQSKRTNPETGRLRKTLDNPDLHFHTSRDKGPDGQPRITNSLFYQASQIDSLMAQAKADGNYHERVATDKDGNPKTGKDGKEIVETVFGVKADAMVVSPKSGPKQLLLNTKTIEKSDFEVGPDVMKYQIDAMKKASRNLAAEREAAKAAEAQAEGKTGEAKSSKIEPREGAPVSEAAEKEAEGGEFA